jgi:hypothetical protein
MNTRLKKELRTLKDKEERPFINSLESAKTLLIGYSREQDEILKEAGLSSTNPADSTITDDYKRVKAAEATYKTECFTGAQIKELCHKYDLRMLPTTKYRGIVPPDTANHIKDFCDRNKFPISTRQLFMLAPTEMFGKKDFSYSGDLMLFYRTHTSDSYNPEAKEKDVFNQIHSWGSEFNKSRKYWFLFDTFVHKDDVFSNFIRFVMLMLSTIMFLLFIVLNVEAMIIISGMAVFISLFYFSFTKIYKLKNHEQWNSDEVYC